MAFPDSFIDEVRHTADIVRFISEFVPLKKAGASWKGLCPFHNEKTPSFNVRAEPPVFHCFGCGEGGDVFKFLMLKERVSFPEAVEQVARRFGISVPETRGFDAGPERKEKEELLGVLEAAAQHFARNLWTAPGARAREYLQGRGFAKETLERIRAGAAPDSWTDLFDALRRRFAPPLLLKAGLVLERQDRSGHYDRFRNRAVFAILNESGKVVGFGARSLDGSEPKYLNSPETPVYQKSRLLYGLNWAKDPLRHEGQAVLMEGYLDVARALEHDVPGAVATCGTALTPQHARLLRRFATKVAVNFDQDEAGRKAAARSLEILQDEGLEVRVVSLPEGHDPDSFLKERGSDAYRQRLDEAPVAMEWLIRRAAAEHDVGSPQGKAAYMSALLAPLGRVASAVERAAWLPRVIEAGRLDKVAAEQELRRALQLQGRGAPAAAAGPTPAKPPAKGKLHPAERFLLALALKRAEGLGEALAELQTADLVGLRGERLLLAVKSLIEKDLEASASALEEALSEESDRRLLREIAVENPPVDQTKPWDCVSELRRLALQRRLKEIQGEVARASGTALSALLQEKLEITRQMAGL
ncbi:MAG: DNA primase [Vicinamibacteria bacterium]